MSGSSYRPRPDNGSGDSPRPPFLTEFVNHIREVFFAHVVYHLIGGALAVRVHPHVERPFRLKTESPRRIRELQAAQAKVSKHAVATSWRQACYFGERCLPQLNCRPIVLHFRRWTREPCAGNLE